eukprot:CAMPEP_0182430496 /NCGR_PEP_ID=MMETSP1167-20130531/41124_1 /TAXON_ID=2988 /ORGANISM="Mallomonas Sp, Strain CCMP3275" /LENGTH=53 /DNA_ID=CAMNT_0024615667 /DNA_START=15 /DNA_END=176 /DNA_ORIENTATION=+
MTGAEDIMTGDDEGDRELVIAASSPFVKCRRETKISRNLDRSEMTPMLTLQLF